MFTPVSPAVRALLEFLNEHDQALQNAAILLGGSQGLRGLQSLLDSLSRTRHLPRKAKHDLVALYHLLSLENVGYPDRVETACYAELEPWDPIVTDLCLLTDTLRNHMDAVDDDADIPVFDFNVAA